MSRGVKGPWRKIKQRRENRELGEICIVNEQVRHRFAE